MCLFKVLKANRVNLWYTCFLGVLRCAESKSAVYQAQKWPLSPQNGPFKDGGHHYAGIYYKASFWLNKVEIIFSFRFSYMGNPIKYSDFKSSVRKLLKTHILLKLSYIGEYFSNQLYPITYNMFPIIMYINVSLYKGNQLHNTCEDTA